MVDKFRRRDDSDDSSSLEEGETRIRDRSKKIDREIPRDRDSRRRGSDRRREYSSESDKEPPKSKHNHNGDHREIRDERDRDSSHKRSDSRIDDRDLPKADDEDLEEKVSKIMKKIDEKEKEKEKPRITDGDRYRGSSRRRRDSGSSESDEELEKKRRNRSGDRDRDSSHKRSDRRRDERDLPKSDDENLEENISNIKKKIDENENEKAKEKEKPRITDGDRYRGSSRRRHDSDLSESDEELEKKRRNRSGDRDTNSSRRGDRRKHESDSSESDGELEKKQRHRSGDRDRDSSRRGDRRRHESDSSDSDGELEKKRHNRKGERDSSRRGDKKKHKSGPSESDEDLEKKRGIRNGDKEISNPPVKSSNFMKWHDDRRNKVSSEEEEKLKDRRNRSEVGERAGKDRHKRDRESEKKFERKRDERDGYERRDGREKEVRKAEDGNNFGNLESRNAPILSNNGASTNINTANSGRSGGVYIPPFKLAQMMKDVEDKSSVEYQRLTWDALRKSINGLVNKVNAANIKNIVTELFEENLIRGRGLFCRSCMKSQMASPGFTDVFSALVAVVNTKFPEVGELLLRRIVLQLKRAYKRNDKHQLLAAVKFIAHLVNQQVAHEIIALELLTVLLENPTDDSVEVAVGFVTECGSLLQDLSPQGLHGIFERFRGILHEGEIDKRVQFLIEGLFAIRKAKFQGHPAVRPELDLVDQEDQLTHELSLEDEIDPETTLDIFKPDDTFVENEKRYEELVKNILGDESVKDEASSDDESLDDEEDEDSDEEEEEQMKIKDETETNLVNLRRTIYLTIMSSVDFEEAGHKLLKIKLEPGQEMELCIMLLECCSQERTYLRYYGLLGQRFCMINKIHQENFEKCFVQQYSMIHRLETNKLRNVAKFFAHLLGTDALPWHVLSYIRLTEEDTTSSSRIFIKILFQELSEHLGIRLLNERLTEPTMQDSFESIFPKDNPKNTRFSINFFTSIGLGGITENLREYLKNMPRLIMQQQVPDQDSDDSDSSPSSSRATSSSSESESEKEVKRKRRRRS